MNPLILLRTHGHYLALLPFLVLALVTGPKLYLEARGAGLLGTPVLEWGSIEYLALESALGSSASRCLAKIRVRDTVQQSAIDCDIWQTLGIGDQILVVDAWTVYLEPEEAFDAFVVDAFLALSLIFSIIFFVYIRRFLDWVEKL